MPRATKSPSREPEYVFRNCLLLTGDYVRSELDYDPDTGILTWRGGRVGVSSGAAVGVRIKLRGATRNKIGIAHLWMHGQLPVGDVVLADGDPQNLRWDNIRHSPLGFREPF